MFALEHLFYDLQKPSRRPGAGNIVARRKKCDYTAERERMTGISSASMPVLAAAILLLLEDSALVVAASAAIEGERHQTATNHQSENDADTQERVAPTGQFNVARMRRPSLIGDVYGSCEQ